MLIRTTIFITLTIVFYSCFSLSINKLVEVNESEDWLYIGGDPGKTNTSKSKSNLEPPFKLYWQFDADGGLSKNCLSVSDAILSASTLNGEFYAIDVATGKSLGRNSTLGNSSFSTPVVFHNNIIVASSGDNSSRIFSYNLVRGLVQWQKNISSVESSPVLIDEDLLVNSLNGKLYKINVKSGNFVWTTRPSERKNLPSSFYTSPTIIGDQIVSGSTDGNLYSFDLTTGKELWKFKTGGSIYCDASVYDGKIYFGSDDMNFYCLDSSGSLVWKKNLSSKFLASSCFYENNIITAGINGNVYAMDMNNGDVKWIFVTKGPVSASPMLHNDKIFIGSYDRNFYCLDADNGTKLWSFFCEGRVKTSAVIWREYIFTASDDKYIYCFSNNDIPKSSSGKR